MALEKQGYRPEEKQRVGQRAVIGIDLGRVFKKIFRNKDFRPRSSDRRREFGRLCSRTGAVTPGSVYEMVHFPEPAVTVSDFRSPSDFFSVSGKGRDDSASKGFMTPGSVRRIRERGGAVTAV